MRDLSEIAGDNAGAVVGIWALTGVLLTVLYYGTDVSKTLISSLAVSVFFVGVLTISASYVLVRAAEYREKRP